MVLPNISPRRKKYSKIATCWIPFKTYRKFARGVIQMGVGEFIRRRRAERHLTFKYELSVMAIMKDEGPYLKEWLDFHILVGVQHFYLYDNGSTDDTMDILKPYIKSGIVELKNWPGERVQNSAYIDAINNHAYDTRWVAEIDLDEFVVPVTTNTIVEQLRKLPRNFGALVLTWIMYGSSGHLEKPDGLVVENYKWRGDRRHQSGCKSIINPRFIVCQRTPHINDFAGFIVDENGRHLGRIDQTWNPPSAKKIRCNHYITKSRAEHRARCERSTRPGAGNLDLKNKTWSPEMFARLDANDVYDDTMDKYIPLLKKMQKSKK